MRKTDAWLGHGPRRTSNTKPMGQEKAQRIEAQARARKDGKKMGKAAGANPSTGTKSWA